MRRALFVAGTLAAALLTAFFFTFNSLFSDGPTQVLHVERIVSYVLIFLAHAAVAAPGSRWGGGAWWSWALLASGPSVVIALLYATQEPTIAVFAVLACLLAAGGALAGARLRGQAE